MTTARTCTCMRGQICISYYLYTPICNVIVTTMSSWFCLPISGFGSLFRIQATVKEFQAVVLFHSVNHSDAVSPKDFNGNMEILKKYCPYPVPYMYNLKYVKHDVSRPKYFLPLLSASCNI